MKLLTTKIFIIFFCFFLAFSPLSATKADAAWIPVIDPMIKQAMEVMVRMIDKMGSGSMKQAAAMALYEAMVAFIEGNSSGGGLIVRDWGEQLIRTPREKGNTRINDRISKAVSGRGGANYEGFGGNLTQTMTQEAKARTSEKKKVSYNYEGDPKQMFSQSDGLNKLSEYINNHPVGVVNALEDEDKEIMTEENKLAQVPAQAYGGFMPLGGLENVSIPGSLVQDIVANIQDIGNKVLAGSDGMAETIITAALNAAINQMVMRGFN